MILKINKCQGLILSLFMFQFAGQYYVQGDLFVVDGDGIRNLGPQGSRTLTARSFTFSPFTLEAKGLLLGGLCALSV